MRWFLQDENFQLGDFIMMTSGLKALSDVWKEKINVFFQSSTVRDLYLNCNFINILQERPKDKYFASTVFSSWNNGEYRKKKLKEEESMQECFFRMYAVANGYQGEMPPTYVDQLNTKKLERINDKRYISVFHGCLGEHFLPKKSIPIASLQFLVNEIVSFGHIPVLLGSKNDHHRFWKNISIPVGSLNYVGSLSIRDSVSILSQCDSFISNDTGLYHVASAYKIKGLVLWNMTEFYKNAPSFSGIERVICKKREASFYNDVIRSYLKKYENSN